MKQICHELGISRQGYYKRQHQEAKRSIDSEKILKLVKQERFKLPMLGGKKLYKKLGGLLHCAEIRMGRDKFFKLLRENKLLIQRKKRYVKTTNSSHRFRIYDNLIKDTTAFKPDEIYVCDLTYIKTNEGFGYLALITDLYSRKIVGNDFSPSLGIEGSIRALKKALRGKGKLPGLIHHSDRGIQYCSKEYIKKLKKRKIKISMSEKGNPYENAVAERMNGILKSEFLLDRVFKTITEARAAIKEAISSYNDLRPHMSIGYLTPSQKYAA